MNVLGGGKLHPRNRYYTVSLAGLEKGGTVLAGIVVGKGDDIKTAYLGHACNIIWCIVGICAGGKTGVDMKIVVILHT